MPLLSMFYGIKVYIYVEIGGKHQAPHIHAYYGDFDIAVDFQGNILEGKFPKKQQLMLLAWIAMHEDEIKANYDLLINDEPIFRIEPLK